MMNQLNLEIACWNINGLISKEGNKSVCKLSKEDFTDNIKKYDIVAYCKLKWDPLSILFLIETS